ncbi:MAG: hypothetical protein CM15mP32_6420 [Flavobacteriaceae bacterium]|nr:MAG: hypothetical protein CM15mP32_6420 [Flavobacteriaceae bacterium]
MENYESTKANLISAGFPFDDQTIMLLRDKDGNKESRRQQISNYKIVLLLGDNLSDFNEHFTRNQMNLELKGLISFGKCLQSDTFYFQTLFMVLGDGV